MTLQERQQEFIDIFNMFGSWQERFQYLMEIGYKLPELPEHQRDAQTRIISCSSRTFFYPFVFEGRVCIEGWSNAAIPSGLIAAIENIFNGCQVDELWEAKILGAIDFHIKTDLINNLTEQRKSALLEMINRILRL